MQPYGLYSVNLRQFSETQKALRHKRGLRLAAKQPRECSYSFVTTLQHSRNPRPPMIIKVGGTPTDVVGTKRSLLAFLVHRCILQ